MTNSAIHSVSFEGLNCLINGPFLSSPAAVNPTADVTMLLAMSANATCVPICVGIIFRARPYVNMLYSISVKTLSILHLMAINIAITLPIMCQDTTCQLLYFQVHSCILVN